MKSIGDKEKAIDLLFNVELIIWFNHEKKCLPGIIK